MVYADAPKTLKWTQHHGQFLFLMKRWFYVCNDHASAEFFLALLDPACRSQQGKTGVRLSINITEYQHVSVFCQIGTISIINITLVTLT